MPTTYQVPRDINIHSALSWNQDTQPDRTKQQMQRSAVIKTSGQGEDAVNAINAIISALSWNQDTQPDRTKQQMQRSAVIRTSGQGEEDV